MPKAVRLASVLLTLSLTVVAVTLAGSAQADPLRLKVDWGKTVVLGQQWLLAGAEAEKASLELRPRPETETEIATPLVGLAPHLSVLGRDWNEAYLFMGRLSTTDVFRLSRSSRMMFTRVRFGDGIIVPFAQVGFGQWRVDTNVLPGWVCDTETAAQLGAGLEFRVGKVYSVALETDYTVLYRDQRDPTNIPYPRFWGGMAATRMRF
jgi:hypothetical protein